MTLNRRNLVVVAVLALVVGAVILTKVRYSPALYGRVVEEGGQTPVAGAVITATWTLVAPINAVPLRYLQVREATTDADGYFELAGWGPVFETASLGPDQPKIEILRRGFVPSTAFMSAQSADRSAATIFPLARASSSAAEYAQIMQLYGRTVVANFVMPPFRCEWRRVPHLVEELRSTGFLPPELSNVDVNECQG